MAGRSRIALLEDLDVEIGSGDGSSPDPHLAGSGNSDSLRAALFPDAPHRAADDRAALLPSDDFATAFASLTIGQKASLRTASGKANSELFEHDFAGGPHRRSRSFPGTNLTVKDDSDALRGGPYRVALLPGGPQRALRRTTSEGFLTVADRRAALLLDGPHRVPDDRAALHASDDFATAFASLAIGEKVSPSTASAKAEKLFEHEVAGGPHRRSDVSSISADSLFATNLTVKDNSDTRKPFHTPHASAEPSFADILAKEKPKDANAFYALRYALPKTTFIGVDCDFMEPSSPPRPRHYAEYVAKLYDDFVAAMPPITPEERQKLDFSDSDGPDLVLDPPDSDSDE